MFSRRDTLKPHGGLKVGDLNPKRFWNWFTAEAQGLANGVEALARGEADADWLLADLNTAIQRYHTGMDADIARTLDGDCELQISGGTDAALAALLAGAPKFPGWRITGRSELTAEPAARRVPYRAAPRPSLDLATLIQGRHEAYAC